MMSLLAVLPSAWQALCKATSSPSQLDALRSISIHAASHRAARLPSLAWMTPLLNLGQQSGPRLMAAWHVCMRKVQYPSSLHWQHIFFELCGPTQRGMY